MSKRQSRPSGRRSPAARPWSTRIRPLLRQQEVAISCNKIGEALLRRERVVEALTLFRRSVAIESHRAPRSGEPGWQRNLSVSQNRLGDALAAAGKTAEALAVYERVAAVREALVAADPANAGWQDDAANALDRLGSTAAK